MSLRHCRLSFVNRTLFGLSNILECEMPRGRQETGEPLQVIFGCRLIGSFLCGNPGAITWRLESNAESVAFCGSKSVTPSHGTIMTRNAWATSPTTLNPACTIVAAVTPFLAPMPPSRMLFRDAH